MALPLRRLRRRLFIPTLIALALLLPALILSFSGYASFLTRDGSTMLILNQGSFRLWRGQPGDYLGALSPGFRCSPFSPSPPLWSPELDPNCKVWLAQRPAAGAAPGTPATAVRITGLSLILPLTYPFALITITSLLCFLPWRTHRRHVRGRCTACAYDLAGSRARSDRCPECGTPIARLLRFLARCGAGVRRCGAVFLPAVLPPSPHSLREPREGARAGACEGRLHPLPEEDYATTVGREAMWAARCETGASTFPPRCTVRLPDLRGGRV